MHVDIDAVGDSQKESARVFQTPLYIRNRKFGSRLGGLSLCSGLDFEVEGHLVVLAVNFHDACDSDLRRALWRDCSLDSARHENDLRKLWGFQDFLVHFFIAAFIAALAAQRVYYNGAAGSAFGWIEMNLAALQFECAVHGMKRRSEGELDGALRGIDPKYGFLRMRVRCGKKRNNKYGS